MSKIPTPSQASGGPKEAFEHILNNIISANPDARETKIKPHLIAFLAHPVINKLLSQSDATSLAQVNKPKTTELQQIHDSILQLTKAIEALKKGNAPPSGKSGPSNKRKAGALSKPLPRAHSAAAGSRPPNPSLVVDLAHLGVSSENRAKPELICRALNVGLSKISPPQVQLAAVRWTAKGNLVITGGPSSTLQSLQTAAPHISAILTISLKLPSTSFISQPRANVKWSKILINGVPTGASKDREPYSPDECHAALAAINPSYATLIITQKPSWVRPPASYKSGAVSSLSVAFEDPDGAKLKALLADKYLYLFGNRVAVKKWKQHPNIPKVTSHTNATEHPTDDDPYDEEDVEITLQPTTPTVPPPINSFLEPLRNKPTPPINEFLESCKNTPPSAINAFLESCKNMPPSAINAFRESCKNTPPSAINAFWESYKNTPPSAINAFRESARNMPLDPNRSFDTPTPAARAPNPPRQAKGKRQT